MIDGSLARSLELSGTHQRALRSIVLGDGPSRRPARSVEASARAQPAAGQSLVEFALVLPLLLFILLLVVDVGRLYYGWVNLQNAARIGANYAALHPDAWGPTPDLSAQAAYDAQIRSDAAAINCVLPSALPTPSFTAGGSTGLGEAEVNFSCRFDVSTPKLLGIATLQLGAHSVFPIRNGTLPVQSPTATPLPTPTPVPTPTPTAMCTVPVLMGTPADSAAATWSGAGFNVSNINISLGTGNYRIATEAGGNLNQPLVGGVFDGLSENCATFVLTVGP